MSLETSTEAASQRTRIGVRMNPDTKARIVYWAARHNLSVNDYVTDAVEAAIARENGDYDLPTLEIRRVNELSDRVAGLSSSVDNLSRIVVDGLGSLMALTRGDTNYLGPEDGEL